MIQPIFTSDNSICDSILTLSKDIFKKVTEIKGDKEVTRETTEVEIAKNTPVSIFAIAKFHGLDKVCIVDSSMTGFWEAYKVSKSLGLQLAFGLKVCVTQDLNKKDEDSLLTDSNVIIFCKNSQAYYDIIKIVSEANVSGFYYRPRIDWTTLNKFWTDNLILCLPFYSSFLSKNLLHFRHSAVPILDKIKEPIFLREEHSLPFDSLLANGLDAYCKANSYEIMDTHTIYYYKDEDAIAYQSLKCIHNRSTLSKPNLGRFGSDKFSFEEYYRKIGKTL